MKDDVGASISGAVGKEGDQYDNKKATRYDGAVRAGAEYFILSV